MEIKLSEGNRVMLSLKEGFTEEELATGITKLIEKFEAQTVGLTEAKNATEVALADEFLYCYSSLLLHYNHHYCHQTAY